MSFVTPSAARKRPLDEIAPPLSTDAPALVLPTKIPAYHGVHRMQHVPAPLPHQQQQHVQPNHQQQQQNMHAQQPPAYPRRVYGSPPHEPHQIHHVRKHLQQPQLSPVTPSASTPANCGPPARIRYSTFNVLDAQNKSPRKAPAKSRRMGIGFDDDHELKTPVVRPSVNPHHDVLMATSDDVLGAERRSDHWDTDHAMPYSPIYVDSGAIDAEMVRRLVAPAGSLPHPSPQQQQPPLRASDHLHQPQLQTQPPQPTGEQKENRTPAAVSRVTKPVAMRAFAPAAPEPAPPVVHISKYFVAKSSVFAADADAPHHAASPFAPLAAGPRRPLHLGFSRKLPLESPGLTPSSAPRGVGSGSGVQSSFVLESDLYLDAFGSDSDKESSDEELAMINNDISLSQEKLQDLSFGDIPAPGAGDHALVLTLNSQLARELSSAEKSTMKELGVYVIALTGESSPIMLGRDQFYTVFGERIRGADVFALSRRHCVLYVTQRASAVSVVVENTSTNGLEVNNRQMKSGERRELQLGDTVTLLKIRSHGKDLSLSYNLRCVKSRRSIDSSLLVRPSIKPREASSDSEESDGDDGDGNAPPPHQPQQEAQPAETAETAPAVELPQPDKPAPDVPIVSKPSTAVSGDQVSISKAPIASAPARRLVCHVQIAEPLSTVETSAQHRGYREELSNILASVSSIDGVQIRFDSATAASLKSALRDSASVVLYAGDGDASHVVTEDANGLPAQLSSTELSAFVQADPQAMSKLLVVFAPTLAVASMVHACRLSSVVFVSSLDAHYTRAAAFLRALFAGVLRGYSIRKCYDLAELVALSDSRTLLGERNDLCALLTTASGEAHDGCSDSDDEDDSETSLLLPDTSVNGKCRAWQFAPSLSASFIPLAPATFVGRESEIADILSCLRTAKVQVCTITGRSGVGKSAVAVFVAKHAHDRRWYRNGVHYYPVERLVRDLERRHRRGSQRTRESSVWGDSESASVRRLALTAFIDDISALLVAFPSATSDDDKTALVVLDGCDAIAPSAFRDSVVDLIARFPAVQFIVAARQDMQIALYKPSAVAEHIVVMQGLGETDAARLLLALARTYLRPAEFARALPDPNVATLAKHEALTRLRGYPLLLTRLALELRRRSLDALKDFASSLPPAADCA